MSIRYVEMFQALTKRTSDSGRTSSTQPAVTSASSAFESLSSSAKHQLAATATSDKQKDASGSAAASAAVSKELDPASHVNEQLVKQVEVSTRQPLYLMYYFRTIYCFFL